MALTQLLSSDTALTYSLMTSPSPVQVTPASGNSSDVALTLVVSAGDPSLLVKSIAVVLPIGSAATDLTNVSTGIMTAVQPSAQWSIGPGVAAGAYVIQPTEGAPIAIGSGLTITIYNIQVSQLVGTAVLTMTEVTSASKDPKSCQINVGKFPYGFFAGNFSSQVPMVQNGLSATLTWVGSDGPNTSYTILWGTSTKVVTDVRSWTTLGLASDTTFILQVQAQVLGQTVTEYFSTTVVVANPSLAAQSLTVQQVSDLKGAVTVEGGLTVGSVVPGSTLAVTGNLTVSGTTGLTGAVTGGAATFGATTLGPTSTTSLTASGPLAASAGSTLTGGVAVDSISASAFAMNVQPSPGNLINVTGATNTYPLLWTQNNSPRTGNYVTGIVSWVGQSSDYGFGTNGQITTNCGVTVFTQLPTAAGHQVVTSPLCLEQEVQASGSARLSSGKGFVPLGVVAELIHSASYRVIATPTVVCQGLAVVNKAPDGFYVEELGGGTSDATFDWFVTAVKRAELHVDEKSLMPASLPEMTSSVTT